MPAGDAALQGLVEALDKGPQPPRARRPPLRAARGPQLRDEDLELLDLLPELPQLLGPGVLVPRPLASSVRGNPRRG